MLYFTMNINYLHNAVFFTILRKKILEKTMKNPIPPLNFKIWVMYIPFLINNDHKKSIFETN